MKSESDGCVLSVNTRSVVCAFLTVVCILILMLSVCSCRRSRLWGCWSTSDGCVLGENARSIYLFQAESTVEVDPEAMEKLQVMQADFLHALANDVKPVSFFLHDFFRRDVIMT